MLFIDQHIYEVAMPTQNKMFDNFDLGLFNLIDKFIMRKRKNESQQSQDEDDYDESNIQQQKIQIRKPKIQRIDNFKNLKKITINVSMTQYPVVTQVAQHLGWKVQTSNDAGDWDVYWTDFSVDPDVLIKMHLFQKINHFPGIYTIARKNLLGHNLRNMGKIFPNEYNFFPMTWMLPQQYSQFRQYYESKQKGKTRTYIVKPQAQCQGRGIFLTRRIQDMQTGKHYVVQRYMAKPYLLQGLKFDMRIYVLMCGTDPLKLYLYNQGLARLATENYEQPNNSNLDRLCMHLTNYAINKLNPKFIFNNNPNNMGVGHKRALSCVMKQLQQKGLDVVTLKQKIKDVIIKTIISGLPLMAHQYKFSQPEDYSGNMCFHILGMDIMLNSKGDPFVIQVNHTPSFTTDTPLDHKIKFNLIRDTLVLMNVNVKKKTELYNRCKQYNSERLITGKRHIYQGQDRQAKINQAQQLRQKHQSKNLGGFQKIYPLDNTEKCKKYEQMIGAAMKMYLEQNRAVKARYQDSQLKKLIRSQFKTIKTRNKSIQPEINPNTQTLKNAQRNILQNSLRSQKNMQTIQNISQPNQQQQNLSLSLPGPATIQKQYDINKSSLKRIINGQNKISYERKNRINIIKNAKVANPPQGIISFDREKQKEKDKNLKSQNTIEKSRLLGRGNVKTTHKRQNPSADFRKNNKNMDLRKQFVNIDNEFLSPEHQLLQKQVQRMLIHKIVLKSTSKPQKVIQKVQKQMRRNYQKKSSVIPPFQGSYVMPKIISLNSNLSKQKDKDFYNFLAMGHKINSTSNGYNA